MGSFHKITKLPLDQGISWMAGQVWTTFIGHVLTRFECANRSLFILGSCTSWIYLQFVPSYLAHTTSMEPLWEILFLRKVNFNTQFLPKILKIKRHDYFTLMLKKRQKYDKYDHDMELRDDRIVDCAWWKRSKWGANRHYILLVTYILRSSLLLNLLYLNIVITFPTLLRLRLMLRLLIIIFNFPMDSSNVWGLLYSIRYLNVDGNPLTNILTFIFSCLRYGTYLNIPQNLARYYSFVIDPIFNS